MIKSSTDALAGALQLSRANRGAAFGGMRWLSRALVWLALAFASMTANAADFPTKPIRFICTSAAGSPLDIMMRQLAKQLAEQLAQPVTVENRTGGSGAVGIASAMNQPADGYTVIAATGSTSFMMASGEVSYSPGDFIVLRGLQAEPSSVAVRKDSPFRTLADFVAAVRKAPDKVNVGGYAVAGFHQFVFYRLQQAAQFRTEWIPFDGGNQATAALLGGHIDVAVLTPSSALAQLQSGDVRLLAISTPERDPYFPNVPTFKEQGFDVVEAIWRGVMVRQGTPPEAIAALTSAMDRIEATPEWQRFMRSNLQSPLHASVDQMQSRVRSEVSTRREFLKSIGVVK